MMELKKIAYNNIKLLANIDTNSDKFINVRDKIILEEKEKDKDFENITEITDIEYPIFFSFNYILTILAILIILISPIFFQFLNMLDLFFHLWT